MVFEAITHVVLDVILKSVVYKTRKGGAARTVGIPRLIKKLTPETTLTAPLTCSAKIVQLKSNNS